VRGASSGSSGRRVLVLGGTSEIALAIVAELQRQAPREVALLGRDPEALARVAAQLREQGCERVVTAELDALDTDGHERAIAAAWEELGGVDVVIVAVGLLGERGTLLEDIPVALEVLRVNLLGTGSLTLRAAQRLREQGSGTLVVLSSVAAQRPRPTNVAYGASKAGLDALAQGLGVVLAPDGVRVVVVRPGFVHTRMTRGLPVPPLASTPQAVARRVVDGLDGRAAIVWAPRIMRLAMGVIRLLPRSLFRRIGG
jgi:decaprenylphospho-beta-D-erythro-pentofuranosid-2-ulose 2-reductase